MSALVFLIRKNKRDDLIFNNFKALSNGSVTPNKFIISSSSCGLDPSAITQDWLTKTSSDLRLLTEIPSNYTKPNLLPPIFPNKTVASSNENDEEKKAPRKFDGIRPNLDLDNLDATIDESTIENLNEKPKKKKSKKKQLMEDKLCLNGVQERTESELNESSAYKLVNMIGNTDVKEMPVNPFDFIWNTKSLMPRDEDGRIVLSEEEIQKMTRNKSILGARVDASDKLQKISINELVLHTSSVAETENNQENQIEENKTSKKTSKKKKDKKQSSKAKKTSEKACDDSTFLVTETNSNDTSEINMPEVDINSQE
ncbi:hypothetical protein BpHYR1_023703 [Brachionus plicatilis]|uniref:Uncharacterized protein n=1 Tax=Brachionus plicatilis TaxID=10195 RepID=A0A3M7RUB3_BRAPC|nr:hypothetical protein BpHYR1_023703 [Brachionus plicatilis]